MTTPQWKYQMNSLYGKSGRVLYVPRASQIGEPVRIIEIPDPVVGNPDDPGVSPDSVPDYVPDSFPVPAPPEPQKVC